MSNSNNQTKDSRTSRSVSKLRTWLYDRHPLVVPVTVFTFLFIVVSFSLVLFTGETVGAADSNIVKVTVDGQSRTVPTRAKNVSELLKKLNIKLDEGDILEPKAETKILEDNFSVNIYKARPVTIIDRGRKTTVLSAHQQPRTIVEKAGIKLFPEDGIDTGAPVDVSTENLIGDQLVVDRAKAIGISLYGKQITIRTLEKTVGDLLDRENIKILPGDTLSPSRDTKLTESTKILILRKGTKIKTVEKVIPAPVETILDPSLPAGVEVVVSEGRDGKRIVTYEIKTKNGIEVSRKILQEVIPVKPVKRVINRGTKVELTGSKADWLAASGIPASQYASVDFIIGRESNWNPGAVNGGGCIGLGQRCGASILIAQCPNWENDPVCQLQHFNSYAVGRYGSWVGAEAAWRAQGWW